MCEFTEQISSILGGSLRQQVYDAETRKIVRNSSNSLHALSTWFSIFQLYYVCDALVRVRVRVFEFDSTSIVQTNYLHFDGHGHGYGRADLYSMRCCFNDAN